MKRNLLICVEIIAILFSACSNEKEDYIGPNETDAAFVSEHDLLLNSFSKALGIAIKGNPDLRKLINRENHRRFDGDYDFLVSRVVGAPVKVSDETILTKGGLDIVPFGELIDYYSDWRIKSGEGLMDEIQRLYPDLQVAMPIHAEEWNPDEYVPVVAFLPEDYDDMSTKTIPGYNSKGELIEIDAIHEPALPVIVVSHNERMDSFDDSYLEVLGATKSEVPDSPYNLSASTSDVAVVLTWEYSGSCSGFSIWRQGPTSNDPFQEIGKVQYPGKSFYDSDIVAYSSYQYYVLAYNNDSAEVYSSPSNQIQVWSPNLLNPLTSFKAAPSGNQILFNWTFGDSFNSDVVIYAKGAYDSSFSCINSTPIAQCYATYTPKADDRGKRVDYYASRLNSLGQSTPRYTFVYPPYRNANENSHTYVRSISVTHNMDGWTQGAPEFYMDVFGLNADGSVTKIRREWYRFSGKYKTKSNTFTNKSVYDWLRLDSTHRWYDGIMIWMHESDGGEKHTFTGTFTLKADIASILEVSASIPFSISIDDGDDDCGDVMLYYFDQPENTMVFSGKYGAQMIISENGQ